MILVSWSERLPIGFCFCFVFSVLFSFVGVLFLLTQRAGLHHLHVISLYTSCTCGHDFCYSALPLRMYDSCQLIITAIYWAFIKYVLKVVFVFFSCTYRGKMKIRSFLAVFCLQFECNSLFLQQLSSSWRMYDSCQLIITAIYWAFIKYVLKVFWGGFWVFFLLVLIEGKWRSDHSLQFSVYNLNATVCVSLAAKFFLVTPKAKMSCLSWSTLRLCLKINKSVCLRFGFDPRGVLSVFDKHKKLKNCGAGVWLSWGGWRMLKSCY